MARTTERSCHVPMGSRAAALVSVLSALGSACEASQAQQSAPVLVRAENPIGVGPRDRVIVLDAPTGARREIYRSEGQIADQVAVSPDGRYVAFAEVVGSEPAAEGRLTLLALSGQVVRTIKSAENRGLRNYVWCCDSDRIAVITGSSREDPAFRPETLHIVDVRTGEEKNVESIWRPLQAAWAAFDSSLYIKGAPPPEARGKPGGQWPVYRYHAPSGRLSTTTHRGIFFSPDGSYYFDPSVEGAPFRLYRTIDDQDVTATLTLPSEQVRWGPEFGWMPGADHALLFLDRPPRVPLRPGQPRAPPRRLDPNVPQVYPDRWNLALDAETGRIIDRFQGDIGAGWKTNASALVVERRTGVELVRPRRR